MFMFRERFKFGAVFPFCIFKLLTTELEWFLYVVFISVSLDAWYFTQAAILALFSQSRTKFAQNLKLHVRNNINYRPKDSECTENY